MSNPLILGRRPCMWCDPMRLTDSKCLCGAAICYPHIATYGPLCPLCVRFGRSRSIVILPIEWNEDTDRSTIPLLEVENKL